MLTVISELDVRVHTCTCIRVLHFVCRVLLKKHDVTNFLVYTLRGCYGYSCNYTIQHEGISCCGVGNYCSEVGNYCSEVD